MLHFLLKHSRQQNFSHGKCLSQAVCLSFPCRKNMMHFKLNCYKFLNYPLKPSCFGQSCNFRNSRITFLGLKKALTEVNASRFCLGKAFHAILKCFQQATKKRKYPKWGGTEWHDHEFLYANLIRRTYTLQQNKHTVHCTPLQL